MTTTNAIVSLSDKLMTLQECNERYYLCVGLHIDAINAFWSELNADELADQFPLAQWTTVQHDLWLLQKNSTIQSAFSLPDAYLHLLWNDSLSDCAEWILEQRPSPINKGEVVAFIRNDDEYFVVHRFESPPLPGNHDESFVPCVGNNWFSQFPYQFDDATGFHRLKLLVIGRVDIDGDNWAPAHLDVQTRQQIEDFVQSTQDLLNLKKITLSPHCDLTPFPTFPSGYEGEISHLSVLQKWYLQSGHEPEALAQTRLNIRKTYNVRIASLHAQRLEIDNQIRLLLMIMQEEELLALESNLNAKRGQTIVNKLTGEKGMIGQNKYKGASLVLSLNGILEQDSTARCIEEELRRGEWLLDSIDDQTQS
jgi:hypothetical protein